LKKEEGGRERREKKEEKRCIIRQEPIGEEDAKWSIGLQAPSMVHT